MKSIKQSDVIKLIKPKYVYLKIIPDTSIRNYNSTNLAKALSHTYTTINKRIKIITQKYKSKIIIPKQIEITEIHKLSFLIDIQKNEVSFYFIVSEYFENIAREKINEIWNKATVEKVDSINNFSDKALKYELTYKKEDALSLEVDKRSNEPLSSILSVLSIMKDKDRIGVFYNFSPCSQLSWKKEYRETMERVNKKLPIIKNKADKNYIIMTILNTIVEFVDGIFEVIGDFLGTEKKRNHNLTILELAAGLLDTKTTTISNDTRKKKDANILNAQFMIISESKDDTRRENNALAVCSSYKNIESDNELIYRKLKEDKSNVFNINDFKIAGVEENKVSVEECQNFFQIPGRDILDQYDFIKKIDVQETQVPKELCKGDKLIGISEYKGNKTEAYLTTDKDYKNLATAIIGATRSGKTSLMGNLARDSVNSGECIIVLDYIENCQLSEDIKKYIPNDKILEINLYDYTQLQGLGYNEAFADNEDIFKQYESSKKQTNQLITLVNSINTGNSNTDFSSKMERYLTSASIIAFIQNSSIGDVFKILIDYKIRHEFIESVPEVHKENVSEYIEYLLELDEWSKATKDNPSEIIGTHTSYIVGVIDRLNKLKQNTYTEMMLKKDCTNNINLLDEMEKNQAIFIKMPEEAFPTAEERDIMTTYWLTKIWMASQSRAWKIKDRYKRKTVTVLTDEIAQLRSAENFIGEKLDQTAKFGVKFILSTMYINQLNIREKLRTANTSYIIISGADEVNYKELKNLLIPFELEDLLKLKRFHSMNLIKYENGYARFITKLPKPL